MAKLFGALAGRSRGRPLNTRSLCIATEARGENVIVGKTMPALVATLLAMVMAPAIAVGGDKEANPVVELSPELLTLLRAEMAKLSGGIQSIPLALVTADWKTIEETSERMHESYIMKQSLTQSQAKELEQKLPRSFKRLDAAFHARAKLLGRAATSKDSELVAFHYSRLLEGCSGCHAAFAKSRFPGFDQIAQEQHQH